MSNEGLMHFPLARVKRIILSDPDVKRISKDASVLISRAAVLCGGGGVHSAFFFVFSF